MGNDISKSSLTTELVEEYIELTYLTKAEIIEIFNKFHHVAPKEIDADIYYRINYDQVQNVFPELKYNPFADRLCSVFSSQKDNRFSFEDVLDLFSVFSKNCPDKVKASWAFLVYDFNDDMQICKNDICEAITRLTQHPSHDKLLEENEKEHIANVLLKEMDLQHTGSIGQLEFQHAISKMSDFSYAFTFNI